MPKTALLLSAIGWTALVCGCDRGGSASPTAPSGRGIVWIVLDTVRADRLGCYGNPRGLTPRLDEFAGGAVRFDNAFSHAPWTLPSFASMFTSQFPDEHGAGGRLGNFQKLPNEAATVAEAFRDAGWSTAEVVNVMFLTAPFNMTQGFEHVDAVSPKSNELMRRADATTDAALRWLDGRTDKSRPYLLLVHYFDAHLTYDPPQPYRRNFADPRDRETTDVLFGSIPQMVQLRKTGAAPEADLVGRLEKLYDGEIAFVDAQVGRLMDGLRDRELEPDIAVTSDHGEEFLEHGGFEHGHALYDEVLRVPLLLRAGGLTPAPTTTRIAGRAVETTVRLIDLAPTFCELGGVPIPASFKGESLVGLLRGVEDVDRPVLSQGNMWGPSGAAWRHEPYKLIREVGAGGARLFDISADPREMSDASGAVPAERKRLESDLDLILKSLERHGIDAPASLTDEERNRLRSLGYVP